MERTMTSCEIDLENDDVLSLSEAASRLPQLRSRGKVHVSTLFRWAQRGAGGRKLQTWRLGGRRVTTLRALEAFIEPVSSDTERPALQASPGRDRELAKVDAALAKEGF